MRLKQRICRLVPVALMALSAACNANMNENGRQDDSVIRPPETDIGKLVAGLESDNPGTRRAAAADLGENGARAAAAQAALGELLAREEVPAVRIAAARAVAKISGTHDPMAQWTQAELLGAIDEYRSLTGEEVNQAGDAYWDALYANLEHIQLAIGLLGEFGASAGFSASDLIDVLNERIGEGYVDLYPAALHALARIGPVAAEHLPALRRFRDTVAGRQNREAVDAAIHSLEGAGPAPDAQPDPATSTD